MLGIASFAVWTGAAWQEDAGVAYWKLAGVLAVWVLAALVVTTLRLLASSPRLLRTLVPATWATAVLAAAVSTQMILGEDESPWKLVVVLVILTALGYALTPILQRFWAAAEAPPPPNVCSARSRRRSGRRAGQTRTRCRSGSAPCV